MPKISVIIPVYNSEKYLKECLDSVVNQTLSDIEIICVNDGSTDDSLKILEEYAKKFNFIKVCNQQNLGVSCARNRGIELSDGEYIFFMDSDDTIEDSFFANINNTIKENPAAEFIVREDGWWFKNDVINIESLDRIPTCAFLIKKSFLELYPSIRFPVGIQPCEDGIFTHKILCLCEKIATCKGAIYNYRKHELSSERSVNSNILCQQIPKWLDIISDFYDEHGLWEAKKQKLIRFLIHEPFGRFNSGKYNYSLAQKIILFNCTKKILKKANINGKDVFNTNESFRVFVRSRNYISYVVRNNKKCCGWFFSAVDESHCDKKYKVICILGVKFKIKNKPLEIKQNTIVSLTSYPARINVVHKTVESLLEQNFKVDKIVLNLGEDKFSNKEKDLPKELLGLIPKGLEINWCKDIRSYTKLLPALKKYPDSIIITVDDDILYPKHLIRKLVLAYMANPKYIHCHRAHLILFDKKGRIKPYEQWGKEVSNVKPSFNNFLTGVGGVLYPPVALCKDVFDEEKFKRLAPMADDIWFWAMAVLNGTKINVIKNNTSSLEYTEGTQEDCLYTTNITKNDEQLKNVLNEYPDILKKLKRIQSCDKLTFWQKIFSIKNIKREDKTHKVICILGVKLKLRRKNA